MRDVTLHMTSEIGEQFGGETSSRYLSSNEGKNDVKVTS